MFRRNPVAMLALSLTLVALWAAGLSQVGSALAKSSGASFSHRATAAKAMPDLKVERVWMGADCKVRVRLRNAGGAGLSPKIRRFTALKIYKGSRALGSYTFREVDPQQKLLKPGGVVVFIVPIEISSKMGVKAVVDPDKKISESDETVKSNTASAILVPCRIAINKLPIRITKAYLRQGTLRLVLTRSKKEKLDRQVYKTVTLKVRGPGGSGSWSLAQLDRGGSLMMKGEVELNTRLKVRPVGRVDTALVWPGGRLEKFFTLRAPTKQGTLAKKSSSSSSGGVHGLASPTVRSALTTGVTTRPDGRSRQHSIDSGITLASPRAGQEVPRGGTLQVRYRFLQPTGPGTVSFYLSRHTSLSGVADYSLSPPSGDIATATTEYRPPRSTGRLHDIPRVTQPYQTFAWRLPNDLEAGDGYRVTVIKGRLMSISDNFKVVAAVGDNNARRPTWGIAVVAPHNWEIGSTQTIAWRLTGDYPSRREFTVKLLRGASTVMTIPQTSSPTWHQRTSSYSMRWTVPATLRPGSDYLLQVNHNTTSTRGVSPGTFAITGPMEVLSRPNNLIIGNPYTVRWRVAQGSGIDRVRVDLVNSRGLVIVEIGRGIPASAGELDWVVGGNTIETIDGRRTWVHNEANGPLPLGPHYSFRVTAQNGPAIEAQSQSFEIQVPRIVVTVDEKNYAFTRDSLWIDWTASSLHRNVKVGVSAWYHGGGQSSSLTKSFCIARNKPIRGGIVWQYGDTCTGVKPLCLDLPCPNARIYVYPMGFRSAGGFSNTFRLKKKGCDHSGRIN